MPSHSVSREGHVAVRFTSRPHVWHLHRLVIIRQESELAGRRGTGTAVTLACCGHACALFVPSGVLAAGAGCPAGGQARAALG